MDNNDFESESKYNLEPEKIAKRLKEYREKKKWTQAEMAQKLGYSKSYYNTVEKGKAKSIANRLAVSKIANKLGINYSWIASGFGPVEKNYLDFLVKDPDTGHEFIIENYHINSTETEKTKTVNTTNIQVSGENDIPLLQYILINLPALSIREKVILKYVLDLEISKSII